jgi:two-component system response regulator HydG
LLAQRLISRERSAAKPITGMTPAAARALLAHPWPGNIRELENCIRHALAVARYDHITLADLPAAVRGESSPTGSDPKLGALGDVERAHILRVLRAVGGNKSLASRFLGLDRKTLYRKLKAFREQTAAEPAIQPRSRLESHPDR